MILIFGLVLATLVLVFFEVLVPGGVLGILAFVCLITATVIASMDYGFIVGLSVFVGTMIASLALTIIEFKIFANTTLGKRFILTDAVTGHTKEEKHLDTLIGKTGTTLTRLNPSGKVSIGNKSYEAFSQDGYLEANQSVRVISSDNFKLLIKKS